jgi:pimeloyl-ACP methyl ester carboxylesterase
MDRFSIVGSSLGAVIAILTYLRAPQRIEKLVLVGPGLLLNPPSDGHDIYEATYKNSRSALADPTYDSCRTRMQRAFFDPAKVPEMLVAMQMMMYASPDALERFERRMAGLRSTEATAFRVDDKLERVGVPTLFLCGKTTFGGATMRRSQEQ